MCPSLPVPSKPLFIKTVLIAGWSKISDFEVVDQIQTQAIVWWSKIHFSGRKIVHFIQLELFPYTTCYIAASVPLPLRPYLTRHITKYAAIIWLCQLLHAFTNWNTPPWVTSKWNSNESYEIGHSETKRRNMEKREPYWFHFQAYENLVRRPQRFWAQN